MVALVHPTDVNIAYIVLGGFAVVFAAFSLLVREKLYLGEVVIATVFGIICGPHAANIFDPRSWKNHQAITLEVMRVVLAAGVFAIGIELPKSYLWKKKRSVAVITAAPMAIGWIISAGKWRLIHALFPRLDFISSLAISATLTPTDPILANAIINGKFAAKHVPRHLRHLLSAESAANDGMAYPFLSLTMYLTLEARKNVAVQKWFLIGWLYEVLFGIVLGALIGKSFSVVMRFSRRRGYIDRESYVAQYIALALATAGLANLLGSDDLLAAFAAGTAVSWDGDFNDQTEDTVFSSVIDLLLNIACFIYIGAWLPFSSWNQPQLGIYPWRLIALFFGILFLRRIPGMLAIYRLVPDIHGWREALFCGHFGPMGVGAVFVSTLTLHRLPEPSNPPQDQTDLLALTIQPIVSFVILGSILIHGLSIPFFNIGRRVHTITRTLSQSRSGPDWLTSVGRYPKPAISLTSTLTEIRSPGSVAQGPTGREIETTVVIDTEMASVPAVTIGTENVIASSSTSLHVQPSSAQLKIEPNSQSSVDQPAGSAGPATPSCDIGAMSLSMDNLSAPEFKVNQPEQPHDSDKQASRTYELRISLMLDLPIS
ncbi:Sodium/hydrogen exchanger family-domain-containing protein [Auriculariales sp. MPI-PUGE-AT-0066]|nr:Sodium/hydrogen exchanger family-domain-containing protein [Auriculariales sp. MPI-PUGE-AT-0066]